MITELDLANCARSKEKCYVTRITSVATFPSSRSHGTCVLSLHASRFFSFTCMARLCLPHGVRFSASRSARTCWFLLFHANYHIRLRRHCRKTLCVLLTKTRNLMRALCSLPHRDSALRERHSAAVLLSALQPFLLPHASFSRSQRSRLLRHECPGFDSAQLVSTGLRTVLFTQPFLELANISVAGYCDFPLTIRQNP